MIGHAIAVEKIPRTSGANRGSLQPQEPPNGKLLYVDVSCLGPFSCDIDSIDVSAMWTSRV